MKVALVTGASGAIGKEIVKELIKEEYFTVSQYSSNESAVEELKAWAKENNLSDYLFFYKSDFKSSKEVNGLCDFALKNFNHVDLLVNNAGIDLYKQVQDTTEEEWDEIFNVNVKASFITTKRLLPKMIERKKGNIIFISSVWGKVGGSMESAYSASKSALIGFSKAVAKEVGDSGINVNAICPGVIDSPMNSRFNGEEMGELISKTPLRRIGTPLDVARAVLFLASERAGFITGETITIDGGFTV